MVNLELFGIRSISPRHSFAAGDKLDEERDVEPNENDDGGDLPDALVIHLAEDLRPPVVHSAEEREERAAHHYIVEVGDDEIGVMEGNIGLQRTQEKPGQAANGEKQDETQGI